MRSDAESLRKSSVRRAGALLLCLLFLLSCSKLLGLQSGTVQAACTTDVQCAPGYGCLEKLGCRNRCTADSDCGAGSRCFKAFVTTACIPVTEGCGLPDPDSGASDGCPQGTSCDGSVCRTQCTSAGQCAGGQDCVSGACVSTDPSHENASGGAGGMSGGAGAGGMSGGAGAGGMSGGGAGSGGTAPDLCAGVTCNTPPANDCNGGAEFDSYDKTGSCADGVCSYVSHRTACTCENHSCTTDPCIAVTCASPPAAACTGTDGNTLTTYAARGTCSAGSCSYAPTNKACTFGCANGACNQDPCSGVTCNAAPAAVCKDTATRTSYASSGTCSGGTCSYAPTDTGCGAGKLCSGGACVTCVNGTKQCSGNSTQLCSGGNWGSTTACSNSACSAGSCIGSCTPNTFKCTTLGEVCTATGSWISNGATSPCSCNVPNRFTRVTTSSVLDTTTGLTWDAKMHAAASWADASIACSAENMQLPTYDQWVAILQLTQGTTTCLTGTPPFDQAAMPTVTADLGTAEQLWTVTPSGQPGEPYAFVVALQPPNGSSNWGVQLLDRTAATLLPYRCVK